MSRCQAKRTAPTTYKQRKNRQHRTAKSNPSRAPCPSEESTALSDSQVNPETEMQSCLAAVRKEAAQSHIVPSVTDKASDGSPSNAGNSVSLCKMDVKDLATAHLSAQHRNPGRVKEKGSRRNKAVQSRKLDVPNHPACFPQHPHPTASTAAKEMKEPSVSHDHVLVTQQWAAGLAAAPATSSALSVPDAPSVPTAKQQPRQDKLLGQSANESKPCAGQSDDGDEASKCIICWTTDRETTLAPCGHRVLCRYAWCTWALPALCVGP